MTNDRPPQLPTFLIVGAAKAGTTTLHTFLDDNEHLVTSDPKEPKFLSYVAGKTQYNGPGDREVAAKVVKTLEAYHRIFPLTSRGRPRGESSTDNLYYHEDVIPLIHELLNDPAIIIILRNPIDRAFSAYTHLVKYQRESLDFEEALRIEDRRVAEGYEFIWHYKRAGLYYDSVRAYMTHFSRVKVLLLNDLRQSAQRVVDETCAFLGVPSIEVDSTRIYNKSGVPKKNWKSLVHRTLKRNRSLVDRPLRTLLGDKVHGLALRKFRRALYFDNLVKPAVLEPTRAMLVDYYRSDIRSLEGLLDRDLSHWLR